MFTVNIEYQNNLLLKKFLENNSIPNNNKVLCQIFTGKNNKNELQNILNELNSLRENIIVIGTTTDGEILNDNIKTKSTVLSFTVFEKSELKLLITDEFSSYKEAGDKVAKALKHDDLKLIISFIDGLSGNGEEYLKAINENLEKVIIAGGLAGDNGNFEKTYVLSNTKILSEAVVAVGIYSNDLIINNDYNFNWSPVGKKLTITDCDGPIVKKIDNLSAYDTYKYYLGEEVANELPSIGIEFPLVLERNGLIVARAAFKNNKDGSLTFAGNFEVGDTVRFACGDSESILHSIEDNIKKLNNKPIESIFIYSCMARRRFFGKAVKNETTPFSKLAPTAGFFSYGEFFSNGKCEFLNQTMTILTLSESNKKNIKELEVENSYKNKTFNALSHLVRVTSEELRKEKQKALEANRIKDMFIANMSHELRTPLNSINIISGVMARNKENSLDETQVKNIKIINKSGNFLLHMINDLLDISKIESGEIDINIDKIDLRTIQEELSGIFELQIKEKNIEFNLQIDETLGKIYSDSLRLKQILKNLISNAYKFTKENGTIYFHIKDENDFVRFIVEDTGIGIEENKLATIFERFKQASKDTSNKYGGTGLGLAISKQLTRLLNGNIKVSSKLKVGTKFEVIIPKNCKYNDHMNELLIDDSKDNETKKEVCLEEKEKEKRKMLILNSNPAEMFPTVMELQKQFILSQVFNFEEFLNSLEENSFDNFLVDGDKLEEIQLKTISKKLQNRLIIICDNNEMYLQYNNTKVIKKPIDFSLII